MKTAAFFDVDYTIVSGSSSASFVMFLFFKGKVSPFFIIKMLYNIVLYKLHRLDYEQMTKQARLPIVDTHNVHDIKKLSEEFFKKRLIKKIKKKALSRISFHKKQRHKVVLATASLDFVVKPVAKYLEVDLISTKSEIFDQYYTGKIIGQLCYGKFKKRLVNEYSAKKNIDLKNSYAYTDHLSDLDFIRLVGHPYAVNPDKRFMKAAKKEHIKIIKF
ncbi:MAG: HAD-IB family hydrolase [Nanoarchaeota archaeon]|nr:HAD-IB family hydrolase [Nanoarchaeota archaeon]